MKTFTLTIKPSRKETREQRLERVRNDKANRSCIHASKKAYKRQDKHKQQYYIWLHFFHLLYKNGGVFYSYFSPPFF